LYNCDGWATAYTSQFGFANAFQTDNTEACFKYDWCVFGEYAWDLPWEYCDELDDPDYVLHTAVLAAHTANDFAAQEREREGRIDQIIARNESAAAAETFLHSLSNPRDIGVRERKPEPRRPQPLTLRFASLERSTTSSGPRSHPRTSTSRPSTGLLLPGAPTSCGSS
jgi:hypothetical protein